MKSALGRRRAGRMAGAAEETATLAKRTRRPCRTWKQVVRLMHKRFVADTPFERLQHLPRYLKAVALRLDKLRANPARDAAALAEFQPLWTAWERRAGQLAKAGVRDETVEQFRWLLEELRVQLFAQELKTPVRSPSSACRRCGARRPEPDCRRQGRRVRHSAPANLSYDFVLNACPSSAGR